MLKWSGCKINWLQRGQVTSFVLKASTAVIATLFLLTGCVTEVSNPIFQEKNPEEAASISVKAGMEYLKAGLYDRAHYHFNRALKLNPKSAETHNSMALLYKTTGEVELEESHYKKAVRYDKNYVVVRNNYGAFLYRVGRYKEAIKHLQKAADDSSYESRTAALVNLGLCAAQLERFDLAENSFKKALKINGQLSRPYLELADIYYFQNRFEEADRSIKIFGSRARHTPRSLWLGIRIAQFVKDKNAEASHILALKNLYPNSEEYALYKELVSERSETVR